MRLNVFQVNMLLSTGSGTGQAGHLIKFHVATKGVGTGTQNKVA